MKNYIRHRDVLNISLAPTKNNCSLFGSDGQYDVRCYIQHNGASRVLGRTYNDNRLTTASASVYLLLTKGDTVTLGGCYGWSYVVSSYYTTFSGALIKQTY